MLTNILLILTLPDQISDCDPGDTVTAGPQISMQTFTNAAFIETYTLTASPSHGQHICRSYNFYFIFPDCAVSVWLVQLEAKEDLHVGPSFVHNFLNGGTVLYFELVLGTPDKY